MANVKRNQRRRLAQAESPDPDRRRPFGGPDVLVNNAGIVRVTDVRQPRRMSPTPSYRHPSLGTMWYAGLPARQVQGRCAVDARIINNTSPAPDCRAASVRPLTAAAKAGIVSGRWWPPVR